MKNFIFYLVCLGFFFPSIFTMHEYVHEETPTARAIAIAKDHQFYGDAPVQAQAELSNNHYTQATAEALPQATSSHTQSAIHFDVSQTADAQPATAIAQDLFNEHDDQPITIYDAKGNIVSEHFINADGSEHNTIHNADGSTTTTIIDADKIKQQETITKSDGSSVIKYYDENGKLQATDVINKDGSKVSIKNSLEGNITDSSIFNKTNELEASMRLDDYGNQRTTTYHADNTTTTKIFSPEQIMHDYDNGSTITSTTDEHGIMTQVIKNNNNVITHKMTFNLAHTQADIVNYDPAKPGVITSITHVEKFPDNTTKVTTKNAHNEITEEITEFADNTKETTKYNSDKTKEIITTNEHDKTTEKSVIQTDGSKKTTMYDPESGNVLFEIHVNANETGTMHEYDPVTKELIFTTHSTFDPNGYKASTKKNAQGKTIEEAVTDSHDNIILESIFNADGSKDVTQYDPSNDTIQSTSHVKTDIQGNIISTTKNPQGKITETSVQHKDGTLEFIDYDEYEKPVSKTVFALDGTSSTITL